MKNRQNIIFILLVAAVLTSCKSLSLLSVDLTVPAKEGLPDEIQSLTLVNRAVDTRFTNDPRDTIQLRFYESQFNLDTLIYDLHAADTLVQSLANLLYESGRYDVVIPEDRFLKKDTLNQFSEQMSWDEAEDLTKRFDTDAVLSLDYYKTGIYTRFGKLKNVNWDSFSETSIYIADMKIDYIANFRLYYPKKKDLLISYFLVDTLEWQGEHYDIKNLFRHFTKVKDALNETAIATALKLSGRIAPEWQSFSRAYFSSGNQFLRETAVMVQNNEWDRALEKWKELSGTTKSKSLLSKLEFNIALAYEMEGNLDEAIRWGLKSYETFFRPVTYNYLKTLEERKKILKKTDENTP